jgi:hypothetical protein
MDVITFQSLCFELKSKYKSKALRRISVFKKVRIFMYTLVLGALNKKVQKKFQHSRELLVYILMKFLEQFVCSHVML